MKKLFAAVSAVALSVMMAALPAVSASADDAVPTEPTATEVIDTPTTEPAIAEVLDTPAVETTEVVETAPADVVETQAVVPSSQRVAPAEEESESNDKCSDDYDKPAVLDNPSGSYTLMVGDTEVGTIDWSGMTVTYDLEEGTTLDLCVKSGSKSNPNGSDDKVTYFLGLTGEGSASILQEISHIEIKFTYDPPEDPDCDAVDTTARVGALAVSEECPDPEDKVTTVTGVATHQQCEAGEGDTPGDLIAGSIALTVSDIDGIEGITYSKNGGASTDVDLTTLVVANLDPGTYDFVVTVKDGYAAVAPFSVVVKDDKDPACNKVEICHWNEGGQGEAGSFVEIEVSVKSIINVPNGHEFHEKDIIPPFEYNDGDEVKQFPGLNYKPDMVGCGEQLPTEGPVVPEISYKAPTCDADGSYTLISPEPEEGKDPKTVTWYVDDVETEAGTYPAKAGTSVTIRVVANGPDYTFEGPDGFFTEITYPTHQFAAAALCGDLTTLALTGQSGSPVSPALTVAALLGLAGVVLVATGVRRRSVEA